MKHVPRPIPASAFMFNLDSSVTLQKLLLHVHTSKSVEKEDKKECMHACMLHGDEAVKCGAAICSGSIRPTGWGLCV